MNAVPLPDLAAVQMEPKVLFCAFAVVRSVALRQTVKNQPYADLKLGDCSRSLPAKVWSDAKSPLEVARELAPGQVVKVGFETELYQGALQLNVKLLRLFEERDRESGFDEAVLFGAGHHLVRDLVCKTLVFDIETVPALERRDLSTTIAETVARHAERKSQDEGMVMALSPFLGKVVSIAVGEGEQPVSEQQVTALVAPPPGADEQTYPDWIRPMSEAELLAAFWSLAGCAETIVSYNGKGFDVPFLIGRSLVHDVKVHAHLDPRPYALRPHLDLLPLFGKRGPATLDVVCQALGIESPKGEMDGSMVAPAYERGEIEKIATYNAHDVRATTQLYHRARDLLLRYRDDWS